MGLRKTTVAISPQTAKYYLLLEDFFDQTKRGDSARAQVTKDRILKHDSSQRWAMRDHMHSIGYGE